MEMDADLEFQLKYPIGRPEVPSHVSDAVIRSCMVDIEAAPGLLRTVTSGLTDSQLDTPYRPNGWTVRQVVHHLPDAHLSTYSNFRAALMEDRPVIRGLNVNTSAELFDSQKAPIEPSLTFFEGLHERWLCVLRGMSLSDFERTLAVPDRDDRPLWMLLVIYAWHGKHHVAQIRALRDRMGWS